MEELVVKPTPLPRSSPTNHLPGTDQEINLVKKPVPLPRTTKAITAPSKGVFTTEGDKGGSESSSFEEVFTKSFKPSTLTKSLKKKLKSASGNVQGKSKVALETTKSFRLRTEQSFKGILQKRQSASPHFSPRKDADSASNSKMDRCQSLPSDNIFNSITFESPIQDVDVNHLCEADDNDSLPPPEYPPPPLPDESHYDALSTKSSYSGSHGDFYTCPTVISSSSDNETDPYLPDLKHLSLCAGRSSSSASFTEDLQTDNVNDFRQSHDPKAMDEKNVSRSESWSFYDTVVVGLSDMQQNEETVNMIVPKNRTCTAPQDVLNNLNTKGHAVKIVVGGKKIESHNKEINFKTNDEYVNVIIDGKSTNMECFNSDGKLNQNEQYVNVSIQSTDKSISTCKSQTEHKVTPLKPLHPFKINNNSEQKCLQFIAKRQESVISSTESEESSVSVQNELYQNWQPKSLSKYPQDKTFNKANISEFDPLNENYAHDKRTGNAGSLPLFCSEEDQSEFHDDFDTASLPVPPTRYDSINNSTTNEDSPEIPNDVEYVLYHRPITNLPVKNKSSPPILPVKTKSTTPNCEKDNVKVPVPDSSPSESSEEREPSPGKQRSSIVGWTSMKMAIKKISEGSHWSPGVSRKAKKSKADEVPVSVTKEECTSSVAERPVINSSSGPIHNGWLYRSSSAGDKQKDFVKKQCQLAEGCLTMTSEQNSSSKDLILLEHVYSIQIVRETKQSNEGEDLYCMEISCSLKDKPHCLGCICTTDRRIWMQKLLNSLTLMFSTRLTTDYSRAGWCFIKEGISSQWLAAWILLSKRTLYVYPCPGRMSEVDLRKARCIVLQDSEEGCVRVTEKGPVLRIDSPHCSYYLQMAEARETKTWCRVLRKAAVDNGPELHDQQLTKDDLPTIIDKCINFVYAHGSMSEGIYRRSGSNINVTKLLTAFQTDAWAVQIARNEYSEHDVASVLKRFFRDLREPLLTSQLHKVLCNAAELKCSEEEKVSLYRSQLEKLPPVNYVTTRRLMGHLHHISQNCERNLMPVDNLAAIWGPTLMHVDVSKNGMDPNWSRCESLVVSDLILLYPRLFLVDGAELAREQRIQEVLERYHNSVQQTPHTTKPSGEIKVWVYIGSRESDCVSVSVSPQREALDVCNELCPKMKVYGHELCLLESVLGGALIRPLHHSERVLDTVLRWGYWDDTDCKDNCLILVINTILRDIAPLAKPPVAQCGELRFADLKSKNFKVFLFEFSQAKLCYYKDKMGSVKLGEWKIEDIVWYIGHEPKRNPHTRSKENPFFGYTIAGVARDEQVRWMAAMLVGEYPHIDLLPRPQLNFLD